MVRAPRVRVDEFVRLVVVADDEPHVSAFRLRDFGLGIKSEFHAPHHGDSLVNFLRHLAFEFLELALLFHGLGVLQRRGIHRSVDFPDVDHAHPCEVDLLLLVPLRLAVVVRDHPVELRVFPLGNRAHVDVQPALQRGERLEHGIGARAAAGTGVRDLRHLVLIHRHAVIAEDPFGCRDRAIALRPLIHHRHIFDEDIAARIAREICGERSFAHALPRGRRGRGERTEAELLRQRRHAQPHELRAKLHARRLRILLRAVFEEVNGRRLRPRKARRLHRARILPAEIHGLRADFRGDRRLPRFELLFKFRAACKSAAAVGVTPVENREVHAEQFPGLKLDHRFLHRNCPGPQPVVAEEPRLIFLRREPLRARCLERRLKLFRTHLPRIVARDQRIEHHRRSSGCGAGLLRVQQRHRDEKRGENGESADCFQGIFKSHGVEDFSGACPWEAVAQRPNAAHILVRIPNLRPAPRTSTTGTKGGAGLP